MPINAQIPHSRIDVERQTSALRIGLDVHLTVMQRWASYVWYTCTQLYVLRDGDFMGGNHLQRITEKINETFQRDRSEKQPISISA